MGVIGRQPVVKPAWDKTAGFPRPQIPLASLKPPSGFPKPFSKTAAPPLRLPGLAKPAGMPTASNLAAFSNPYRPNTPSAKPPSPLPKAQPSGDKGDQQDTAISKELNALTTQVTDLVAMQNQYSPPSAPPEKPADTATTDREKPSSSDEKTADSKKPAGDKDNTPGAENEVEAQFAGDCWANAMRVAKEKDGQNATKVAEDLGEDERRYSGGSAQDMIEYGEQIGLKNLQEEGAPTSLEEVKERLSDGVTTMAALEPGHAYAFTLKDGVVMRSDSSGMGETEASEDDVANLEAVVTGERDADEKSSEGSEKQASNKTASSESAPTEKPPASAPETPPPEMEPRRQVQTAALLRILTLLDRLSRRAVV